MQSHGPWSLKNRHHVESRYTTRRRLTWKSVALRMTSHEVQRQRNDTGIYLPDHQCKALQYSRTGKHSIQHTSCNKRYRCNCENSWSTKMRTFRLSSWPRTSILALSRAGALPLLLPTAVSSNEVGQFSNVANVNWAWSVADQAGPSTCLATPKSV